MTRACILGYITWAKGKPRIVVLLALLAALKAYVQVLSLSHLQFALFSIFHKSFSQVDYRELDFFFMPII